MIGFRSVRQTARLCRIGCIYCKKFRAETFKSLRGYYYAYFADAETALEEVCALYLPSFLTKARSLEFIGGSRFETAFYYPFSLTV